MTGLSLDAGAIRAADTAVRLSGGRGLLAVLILGAALAAGASTSPARAANECGAPLAGVVVCSGSSYPAPGISYTNVNGLTLTLDNPALVAVKTTTGQGAVYVGSSASNTNDIVVNALRFQSAQTTGTLSNGVAAVNTGTAGNAIIRMDTGTVSASGNALSNALLATVTNGASTGDASIILNGGQASNTGAGHGASALNAGTGNAAVTLAGGSVSSNTGIGVRAIVSNAAGMASVAIGGGTVTTASGTGVLSQAELGSSGITMTGGTVTVQGGANPAVNAVVNNAAGTGTASIVMSGGTVTNNGSGDGLFANNKGTGTYTISLTGGTVTGGAGTGAAIRGEAVGGGAITIGSAAVVNAGASGIALNQAGGAAAITTAGTVTGDINLSAAANTLDILGGTIDGNIGGGGNSALDFDLGLGSFTYGSAYAIADMDSIAMTSGSAWIEGTLNTNTLNLNGGALHLNGTATAAGGAMVAVGGSLFGTGILNGNVTNAGIIAPGNSIGTLTINGDYAGAGGLLEIETMLGDDSSATDRLIVTGDTSGSTNVHVTNVGGAGGQTVEGIKIVDVGGASNGSFSLLGDYVFEGEQAVVGGAYAYRLYQGGIGTPLDGDWYLRSALIDGPDPEPLFQAGAPLYEVYGNVLQQSFASLETLQQRTGSRSSGTAGGEGEGLWGRIVANHAHFSPESSTTGASHDVTTWRLQAGADGIISQSEAGELVGGLNVEFGTISADVASIYGDGSISSLGFGGGGTLTFYGGTGFYLDA